MIDVLSKLGERLETAEQELAREPTVEKCDCHRPAGEEPAVRPWAAAGKP